MPKRLFVAFAVEDANLRDLLRGQARNERVPFEFVDMSAKSPWDAEWKRNCRTRIRGCDGVVAIITSNSKNATGQLWEINCSLEEGKRVLFLDGNQTVTRPPQPYETKALRRWTWANIKAFIDGL